MAQALRAPLTEASDLLFLLIRQGEILARDPTTTAKTKFLSTWQRVREALLSQEHLALLAALWVFESERPGLELHSIVNLAVRFRELLFALERQL